MTADIYGFKAEILSGHASPLDDEKSLFHVGAQCLRPEFKTLSLGSKATSRGIMQLVAQKMPFFSEKLTPLSEL